MLLRCVMFLVGVLPAVAVASEPAATFPPAAIREDFRQLHDTLRAAHFDLYVETPAAEYDAAFAQALAELDRPMTRAEIISRFQRFVALGRVAHARVEDAGAPFAAHLGSGGAMLPLFVRVRDGRAWIREAYSGLDDLELGDEILAIDGAPIGGLLERMRAEVSADTPYLADSQLEQEFPRLAWQLLGSPEDHAVSVARGGTGRTVQVPTITLEALRTVAATLPDALLDLSWTAREARVLDGGIGYLRPGPFYDVESAGADGDGLWGTAGFDAFLDDSFSRFRDAAVTSLLIDLRNNPGGDNSFSDLMIARFADRPFRFHSRFEVKVSEAARAANARRMAGENPGQATRTYAREYAGREPGEVFELEMPLVQPRQEGRFDGEVHALVNRHSYSNAVTVAAMLQDYGFATILGEETADLATTLGAMEQFELTNTGIRVGFPKARIVRPSGDLTRRGVVPDVPIETPIIEPASDPVLQAALAVIRGDD